MLATVSDVIIALMKRDKQRKGEDKKREGVKKRDEKEGNILIPRRNEESEEEGLGPGDERRFLKVPRNNWK